MNNPLARVEGNWQRLNEISFAPVKVKSITLKIEATNGAPLAAVYEIRAEA